MLIILLVNDWSSGTRIAQVQQIFTSHPDQGGKFYLIKFLIRQNSQQTSTTFQTQHSSTWRYPALALATSARHPSNRNAKSTIKVLAHPIQIRQWENTHRCKHHNCQGWRQNMNKTLPTITNTNHIGRNGTRACINHDLLLTLTRVESSTWSSFSFVETLNKPQLLSKLNIPQPDGTQHSLWQRLLVVSFKQKCQIDDQSSCISYTNPTIGEHTHM
jgi:hypothetical protein